MASLPDPLTLAARAEALEPGVIPDNLNLRLGVEVRGLWSYTLIFSLGTLSVIEGLACDVSVHLSQEAAQEIVDGTLNAQRAIEAGSLKLGGELRRIPVVKELSTLGSLLGVAP